MLILQNTGEFYKLMTHIVHPMFANVVHRVQTEIKNFPDLYKQSSGISADGSMALRDLTFREALSKGLIRYYLQDLLLDAAKMPKPQTTPNTETDTMPEETTASTKSKIIDKPVIVNGEDIRKLREDTIVNRIQATQNKVADLKKLTGTGSKRIEKDIAKYEEALGLLVAELDSRPDPE